VMASDVLAGHDAHCARWIAENRKTADGAAEHRRRGQRRSSAS